MKLDRRHFLAASAASAAVPSLAAGATAVITPEEFGAKGDGVANDSAAFARLSAEVTRRALVSHMLAGQTRFATTSISVS